MQEQLLVTRFTERKLNQGSLDKALEKIRGSVNKSSTRNTTAEIADFAGPVELDGGKGYQYSFKLNLENLSKADGVKMAGLKNAKKLLQKAIENEKWKLLGDAQDFNEDGTKDVPDMALNVPEFIPAEFMEGIYERDAHVRIIHDGVKNFHASQGKEREHTLLFGPPAACKTELFRRLKKVYESDDPYCDSRVLIINATTLTQAGLENFLLGKLEDGLAPKIIVFDEIEKIEESKLSCLLQIMDGQGKISKMNARIGQREGEINCLVWATCNDLNALKRSFCGALYSRFTKTLPCSRPSAALMLKILKIRIQKLIDNGYDGNLGWAEKVMEYAKKRGETDPRKIIGYLSGRHRIDDGSYFKDLEHIEEMAKVAAEIEKQS